MRCTTFVNDHNGELGGKIVRELYNFLICKLLFVQGNCGGGVFSIRVQRKVKSIAMH